MHIKQVIIQGFKSFREQIDVEPFHRGHNVIVGRNGSGKTNFFNAIQFVLSDEYSRMRSDHMQNLLHEGIGPRVMSAFVEIIFDNTDGRLPIEKGEVFLRRVIGPKKDQYFLNKKLVTRVEVTNLLETAGFSQCNPYYIVKQGKINQMAIDPDTQRLKILREVAGTRVYDEKRRESNILLKDTEGKLEKINEMLRIIDERLDSLQGEKDELNEFLQCDSRRRFVQYVIYDRELKDSKKKLHGVQQSREDIAAPIQKDYHNEMNAAKQAVQEATKALKESKKEVKVLKEERNALNYEQQELLKQMTKLTLTVNDLKEEVSGDNRSRTKAQEELNNLVVVISDREAELNEIKPKYEQAKISEEEKTSELALKEQKRTDLYAKLGRSTAFHSKSERDEWIKSELIQLKERIEEAGKQKAEITKDLENDEKKKEVLKNGIEDLERQVKSQNESIKESKKKITALIELKDQCQANRKEQYRRESVLQNDFSGMKDDLLKADQSLRSMIGMQIINGRDSVKKVLRTFREQGVPESEVSSCYGLLIDVFQCEKDFYTAVDVTAGNRLFYHVIGTDAFSSKILKEMNRQNLPGDATFMPLNRLEVSNANYPESNDAFPMLAQLRYDPKYDKAIRHVFGRTLLCRNLTVATEMAKTTGFDCVTTSGDRVSARGPLSGGYFDSTRSKMTVQRMRTRIDENIRECEVEISNLQAEISETEKNVVDYVTQIQKAEIKNSKAKDNLEQFSTRLKLAKGELATLERYQASKEQSLAQCTLNLAEMKAKKDNYESELQQELMSQLSEEDQQLVDELNDNIRRLTKENKKAFSLRMNLEAEKNKLENLLLNNLVRRRDELIQSLQKISFEDRKRKLESTNEQLERANQRLDVVETKLRTLNDRINEAGMKVREATSELENSKLKEKEAQDKIEAATKDLAILSNREFRIQKNITELTQKISELETIPNHEKYSQLCKESTRKLLALIEDTNKELKQYSHVNAKALDQFTTFSEQKLNLSKRKDELDRGSEKIKELMAVLEQKKYEAIQFTFRQVSKNFSEIFHRLVPNGHGQLVMRIVDGDEEEDRELEEEADISDRFVGVGIRVSFTGGGETHQMNQLSGGQKSLVALTLIFAIQRCDPAPFYLFDEIDQALDAEHRKAVADMIHELSAKAQFITTTFRSELLTRANKFYGVKFHSKVSHVDCITREEALNFLEDDSAVEEATQERI